ncbi:hypothetical protein BJ878DRAFT_430180, partial [Calycina marina]
LFLNDWSHETTNGIHESAQTNGLQTLDIGLINGTNTFDGVGERFTIDTVAGEKYRVRLANGAIDSHF